MKTFDLSALPSIALDEMTALPECRAVYFVFRNANELVYIGRAYNLFKRWREHHKLSIFKSMKNVRIMWKTLDGTSNQKLNEIEQQFIRHFKPSLNAKDHIPMTKMPITLPPGVAGEVDSRNDGNRSAAVATSLERYFSILKAERGQLAQLFSDGEAAAILDSCNGVAFMDTVSLRLVWANVEDSLADGLAEKWQIDGPALVAKLRGLTYAQSVTLVDATEQWWRHRTDDGPTVAALFA